MASARQRPPKAYKNLDFLNSPAARHIRLLCEYEEPRQRFMRLGIRNTIVFFGSARALSSEDAHAAMAGIRDRIAAGADPEDPQFKKDKRRAEIALRMSKYYDESRELSRRLTAWSMERHGPRRYVVCSGGGPGIMEATNRGAADVPGGRSIGLGISLPFEQGTNEYVTADHAFEFHYFFTRKYWFLYLCKGLVIFPGGFGTLDELFETLTLVQTGKIKRKMPIVLFGNKDYWSRIFDLSVMAEFGTISPDDLDLIHLSDDVDEAFEYLKSQLEEIEHDGETL